ncbi:hypothetical protein [Vibrio crassostreae]|uniref:Glycosyltransferase involved in cell wall biosynthesis n=1 Tax=Vibrio crassostreae TaxID=246167 RepID=A0ABP1WNP9_9VIBR|nr:hypothetical protein [Vibrio crassostreae]TCL27632.1 hypothetical protein EDB52_105187 [Vibrio crassostreae]TCT49007.1 hypothetical protein EDB39_106188 [Vibrio crassostreae]TCT58569.1 hypothetical protein EDB40_10677 [Vibrio crassostreae]CAK1709667.1 Glycosyl transferase family 1 domain-containing protein [Vibrio crassostreae]CAK1711471.1 Glycosyl transferase family 1 domain-containing protein [Vibrio crassostreae]
MKMINNINLCSGECGLKTQSGEQSIGFIIGNFGKGIGGHYWDLKTISEKLNTKNEIIVFNVGVDKSPVLEQTNVKVIDVPLSFFKATASIKNNIRKYNVAAIYSIDIRVDFISMLVCNLFKIPLIMIKPGGPNPNGYYPVMNDLIVFSSENYEYFLNSNEHKDTNIHFMPNRSSLVNTNNKLVTEIINKVSQDSFKFVQVIRITKDYYNNLLQSIDLIRKLKNDNFNVSLIIIGVVQDIETMTLIEDYAQGLPVYFFSSNEYTKCGSELLGVGDIVIANGRSVMEASSLSLPTLVSAKNTSIPVLLNKNIFAQAFSVNFSPRFELPLNEKSELENYESIKELVLDKNRLAEMKEFSKVIFEKYFNVDNVLEKYLTIANEATFKRMTFKAHLFMMKKYLSSIVKMRLKL